MQKKSWVSLVFYTGFALIATHELDAVFRSEWRLLPGLSLLNDDHGRTVFILGHIPLFALLAWAFSHDNQKTARMSKRIFDVLLVFHAAAHFLLSDSPYYEFMPPVETVTVYGAAIMASLHLWLDHRVNAEPGSSGPPN